MPAPRTAARLGSFGHGARAGDACKFRDWFETGVRRRHAGEALNEDGPDGDSMRDDSRKVLREMFDAAVAAASAGALCSDTFAQAAKRQNHRCWRGQGCGRDGGCRGGELDWPDRGPGRHPLRAWRALQHKSRLSRRPIPYLTRPGRRRPGGSSKRFKGLGRTISCFASSPAAARRFACAARAGAHTRRQADVINRALLRSGAHDQRDELCPQAPVGDKRRQARRRGCACKGRVAHHFRRPWRRHFRDRVRADRTRRDDERGSLAILEQI